MIKFFLSKLSKEDTIELNEIISSIRINYIQEIELLSKKQADKSKWYGTPFGSKNTHTCKVLEQIGLILLAKKKVQIKKLDVIIVRNRNEKIILSKLVGPGVKIEVELKSIWMNIQFFRDFSYLFKYVAAILAHYISYKLVNINNKNFNVDNINYSNFTETILYSNSFTDKAELSDRHLGNIWDDHNHKDDVIFPVVYGLFNFYRFYALAIKSKYNFIFIQDLICMSDALAICFYVRKLRHDTVPKFEIEGVNFSRIVSQSLRRHKYKPSTLYGHARFKAIRNIEAKHNWKVEKVLRWHENHEVDHLSVLAWHSLNNRPLVTGYVDAFPARNFLAPYVTEEEIRSGSYPDKQLFIGDFWRQEFGSFVKCAPHFLASSRRFEAVWNFKKQEIKGKIKDRQVLISLPVYNPEKSKILEMVSQLDRLLNNDEAQVYRYIIRPHPADSAVVKLNCNKLKILIDRTSEFDDLLDQSEIVISSISSVQLQALLNGKRAVTVSSLSRISSCSVPKTLYDYGYDEIYDVNQLIYILVTREEREREPIDDLKRSMFVGRKLRRLYW